MPNGKKCLLFIPKNRFARNPENQNKSCKKESIPRSQEMSIFHDPSSSVLGQLATNTQLADPITPSFVAPSGVLRSLVTSEAKFGFDRVYLVDLSDSQEDQSSQGMNSLKNIMWNTYAFLHTPLGKGLLVFGPLIVEKAAVYLIGQLGFSVLGIDKDSPAAEWMRRYKGTVPANSWLSWFQSMGAKSTTGLFNFYDPYYLVSIVPVEDLKQGALTVADVGKDVAIKGGNITANAAWYSWNVSKDLVVGGGTAVVDAAKSTYRDVPVIPIPYEKLKDGSSYCWDTCKDYSVKGSGRLLVELSMSSVTCHLGKGLKRN